MKVKKINFKFLGYGDRQLAAGSHFCQNIHENTRNKGSVISEARNSSHLVSHRGFWQILMKHWGTLYIYSCISLSNKMTMLLFAGNS